jgi:hypothetical protein
MRLQSGSSNIHGFGMMNARSPSWSARKIFPFTNLYVKYHLGLAYAGSGQTAKAKKKFEDVALFNSIRLNLRCCGRTL